MAKNTPPSTIRDETLDTWRRLGLTRIFANPGSTEVSLLVGLPEDFDFVLGLHEGAVVGMATGYALATGHPALVIVHTTAGLGNAVGAIATARVNRAPLVVIVGQQDRRHLATEPFLAGRLRGLAGDYPVSFTEPATAQDVPSAITRAFHDAQFHRGPAIVVVPMDDWLETADPDRAPAAASRVRRSTRAEDRDLRERADLIDAGSSPVIVAGAGNDTVEGWRDLALLAERLGAPVYQEAFAGGAGFPQDHPNFAGFVSPSRSSLRAQLSEHDVVLAVGAPAFRLYLYEPGPLLEPGTTILAITADAAEAHRSPADFALIAPPGPAIASLLELTRARSARSPIPQRRLPLIAGDGPLRASEVMARLGQLLPREAIVVEESPSTRPELHELMPAREPLGFVSAAMGGLGFGLPAAIGLRMGAPTRPVVAVLGDGSAMYGIQGLWSAAHYNIGALFVILHNGRYAVMDRLADHAGADGPWPTFEEIDYVALAGSFGCTTIGVADRAELHRVISAAVETLGSRTTPLVIVVDVEPETTYTP
jgi:benzoylformate decarboxylase